MSILYGQVIEALEQSLRGACSVVKGVGAYQFVGDGSYRMIVVVLPRYAMLDLQPSMFDEVEGVKVKYNPLADWLADCDGRDGFMWVMKDEGWVYLALPMLADHEQGVLYDDGSDRVEVSLIVLQDEDQLGIASVLGSCTLGAAERILEYVNLIKRSRIDDFRLHHHMWGNNERCLKGTDCAMISPIKTERAFFKWLGFKHLRPENRNAKRIRKEEMRAIGLSVRARWP